MEILRLKKMLEDAGVEFVCKEKEELHGWHIFSVGFTVKSFDDGWSVIEHDCSYGRKRDLLEVSAALMTEDEKTREADDVLGFLTAEQVFARILEFEKRRLKNENL